ncbi:hypothetical protein CHUAL_012154 [Chamberlinius hualienensis]
MSLPTIEADATEKAYNKCVEESANYDVKYDDDELYCPRTFDGWSCWNATVANQIAIEPCPSFITGFDPKRYAHKICNSDGTWFRHPETNLTWSNYTTCVDMDDLKMRKTIIKINIIGYSISLVALTVSLAIFFYFRSLKCIRIRIHRNLFISFVMNNATYIIWYTVIAHPEVVLENQSGCQVLHVVVQYFLVCNYFWMFCEGLYLHTILVIAFVDKESIMKWLYVIGWGAPVPLTVTYAAVRGSFPKETELCWINDSPYYWILTAPVCVSMLANLVFLISIVRVLVTKLRAVKSSDTDQTKKAVRATIILIPLLGLNYLLTPFRPQPGSQGEHIYDVIAAVVTSFQGLCVSLLFCFCNAEIIYLIKNIWFQKQSFGCWKNTSLSLSSVTVVNNSPCDLQRRRHQTATSSSRKQRHICLTDITPSKPIKKGQSKKWWRSENLNNNKRKDRKIQIKSSLINVKTNNPTDDEVDTQSV